jgi:uncharacterized protein YycO
MNKKIRGILCFLVASIMFFSTSNLALANSTNSNFVSQSELETSYETLMDYAKVNGIPLELSLETFIKEYEVSNYTNISDYVESYYSVLKKPTTLLRSSNATKWYYNTGTSLPQAADYSTYNLLNTVQKGDIIFEANGGYGITAHTAIVEGIFYSSSLQQYYIRVIEAIDDGVVRSVLDDERVNDKGVTVLRVTGATSTQVFGALNFCLSQLGKGYSLDFAKDTSSSEADWYCSELIWAGFYNRGINIETTGIYNEPGITPRDILNCSKVTKVSFK